MDGEIYLVTSCEMDGFDGGLLTLAGVHGTSPQLVLLNGGRFLGSLQDDEDVHRKRQPWDWYKFQKQTKC